MKKLLIAFCALLALSMPAFAKATCQTSQVVMFMTTWCPYCRAAGEFFEEHGVDVRKIDVEHPKDGERPLIDQYFNGKARGVPHIIVEGQAVSGFWEPRLRELLCVTD